MLVVLSLFGYLLLFPVAVVDVAVVGPIDGEWWRVATSPFLYGSVWYELAAVTAIAVFGWLLERRHGPLVVLVLFVLCGMGGIALAVAVDPTPLAIGGNGAALGLLCAWAVPDLIARSRGEEYDGDLLGTAVFAVVLLLMPLAVPRRARSPASRAARPACWSACCWPARASPDQYPPPMPDRRYSAEEVDAAVAALGDPERFAHAQEIVTHAAPGLQHVLNEALAEGGWFGGAHEAQLSQAASAEDPDERLRAMRTLVAEETRLGMLVGVAVGLELAHELMRSNETGDER